MAKYKLTTLVTYSGSYLYPNIVWENLPVSIRNLITNKQDKLVSGTNIKTIGGNDILGEGNLDLSSLFDDYETKTLSFTYADGSVVDYNVLVKKNE